ncbi:MAG: outer membrane beta-barrel protein [Planctomycetota bacterium]
MRLAVSSTWLPITRISGIAALLLCLATGTVAAEEDIFEPLPSPVPEEVGEENTGDEPSKQPTTAGDSTSDYSPDEELAFEQFDQYDDQSVWSEETSFGGGKSKWWSMENSPLGRHAWVVDWLGRRHSSTHGRAIGPGQPLRGTSWLNRPYEIAAEFGALVMTDRPSQDVRSGNDLFAAIHAGWDWDHYWGGQVRVGWSTPELDNPSIVGEETSDNLFIFDTSVLYYPWGDSRTRPYLRVGVGLTDLEFTNSQNVRQAEHLFTVPLAIGIKHQMRRTMAWRAEFANNWAIGANEADSINNITLTFGLEGRFGGRSASYWAWNPRARSW